MIPHFTAHPLPWQIFAYLQLYFDLMCLLQFQNYPNLAIYLRDIYQLNGVADTC
ncbi:hypothetical protein [Synechococcus sp. PCC 7502]|uniref:hypothetical protein n=1 Tax=Synechococcus sp. PCC 7502 TaxID=1173263 RepID=UPI0002DB4200|nr:hypothetical protein [Synechococcus sp. PCC 7502]